MKLSFEMPLSNGDEVHGKRDPRNDEEQVLHHTMKPRNYLESQLLLAMELYEKDNPNEKINIDSRDQRNAVMLHWGEQKHYDNLFGKIRLHPLFISGDLFEGDFAKITLDVLDQLNLDPDHDPAKLSVNHHN